MATRDVVEEIDPDKVLAGRMESGGVHGRVENGSVRGGQDTRQDMRTNYRTYIQRALRTLANLESDSSHSNQVSMEGLKGLPGVSLQGFGRIALPLTLREEGAWNVCVCMLHILVRITCAVDLERGRCVE
jgi:hypothetical protein